MSVQGADAIPSGGAILVANHSGALPYDGLVASLALLRERPDLREPRWLVEDQVFHAPVLGTLTLSLLLGTPILSLLGAVGAALTLGARGGGSLLALLVLPLYAPVLIFGAGAVDAVRAGLSATPHLSLLGAGLLIALVAVPFAVAAAVRIALD